MPRSPDKNEELREHRKRQILDAALNVYIRFGFHGADMDVVAKEAGLAKGLVYYYYKTKKDLFTELYMWMYNEGISLSNTLLGRIDGKNPVEQLMCYTYNIFLVNDINPRMMQFAIRVPFDAYAIFGPEVWKDGVEKSDIHRRSLAKIIQEGIEQGLIPATNPSSAANSFWSVFVANSFEYSKLMAGEHESPKKKLETFRDVVRFCFQGLGIEAAIWNHCLTEVIMQNEEGGCIL